MKTEDLEKISKELKRTPDELKKAAEDVRADAKLKIRAIYDERRKLLTSKNVVDTLKSAVFQYCLKHILSSMYETHQKFIMNFDFVFSWTHDIVHEFGSELKLDDGLWQVEYLKSFDVTYNSDEVALKKKYDEMYDALTKELRNLIESDDTFVGKLNRMLKISMDRKTIHGFMEIPATLVLFKTDNHGKRTDPSYKFWFDAFVKDRPEFSEVCDHYMYPTKELIALMKGIDDDENEDDKS